MSSLQQIILDYQAEAYSFNFGSESKPATVRFKGAGTNSASVVIEGNLEVIGTHIQHDREVINSNAIVTGSVTVGDGVGTDFLLLKNASNFNVSSDGGSSIVFSIDGGTGNVSSSGSISALGPITISKTSGTVLSTAPGSIVNIGGAIQIAGDISLGVSSSTLAFNGLLASSLLFAANNTYDIGAVNKKPRNVNASNSFTVESTTLSDGLLNRSGNFQINLNNYSLIIGEDNLDNDPIFLYGDLTLGSNLFKRGLLVYGNSTFNSNVVLGSAADQTIVFNALINSNVRFLSDNSYDLGSSSDNRPRDLYVARKIKVGDSVIITDESVTGTGLLNLQASAGNISLIASNYVTMGTDNSTNRLIYLYGDTAIGSSGNNRNFTVNGAALLNGNVQISNSGSLEVGSGQSTFNGPVAFNQLIKINSELRVSGNNLVVDTGGTTPTVTFKVTGSSGDIETRGTINVIGGVVSNSTGSLVVSTSGVGNNLLLQSGSGSLTLKDSNLSSAIPLSQTGVTGLLGFSTGTSVVGALNELRSSIGGTWVFNQRLNRDSVNPAKFNLPSSIQFIPTKIMVFVNGVLQFPGATVNDQYQESGIDSVLFNSGSEPALTDDVFATYLQA